MLLDIQCVKQLCMNANSIPCTYEVLKKNVAKFVKFPKVFCFPKPE